MPLGKLGNAHYGLDEPPPYHRHNTNIYLLSRQTISGWLSFPRVLSFRPIRSTGVGAVAAEPYQQQLHRHRHITTDTAIITPTIIVPTIIALTTINLHGPENCSRNVCYYYLLGGNQSFTLGESCWSGNLCSWIGFDFFERFLRMWRSEFREFPLRIVWSGDWKTSVLTTTLSASSTKEKMKAKHI